MNLSIRDMILVAMFAALTAVGAFIRIPTPIVPFTLQFLFCAYSGVFLGGRKGLYSQLLYIMVGLIGMPIFANGGGPAYVLQPTFGYLLGFALCSYMIGSCVDRWATISFSKILGAVLAGLTAVYVVGVSYLFAIVNLYLGKEMPISKAIAVGFLPYVISDVIMSVIIAYTAMRVLPILRQSGLVQVRAIGRVYKQ